MYLSLTSKDCGVFSYKQGRSLGGLKMRKKERGYKVKLTSSANTGKFITFKNILLAGIFYMGGEPFMKCTASTACNVETKETRKVTPNTMVWCPGMAANVCRSYM